MDLIDIILDLKIVFKAKKYLLAELILFWISSWLFHEKLFPLLDI